MPVITGGHHVALTVRNADASAAWYCELLGMQVVLQGDDPTVCFRVLADPDSGWMLGVRQYHGHEEDSFDELRTGLDHFAFGVTSLPELQAWEEKLQEMGVIHSPIAETPIGSVIVFRDPDNIQMEFWLPAGQ